MSSYRHIEPRIVFAKQTLTSGGGQVFSTVHDMRTMTRGAVQFTQGAGLTSALAVFASVDGVNFFDLALGIPNLVGAGNWGVDLSSFGYPYYKAAITPTAGSGTMVVWANAKGA